MNSVTIGERIIGPGNPAFVIAEIGVNHDGSMKRALELVDLAQACGADAVKLQIFAAAELMNPSSAFADYQKDRVADASPVAMLQRYELRGIELVHIVEAIRKRGMVPIATPFSIADVRMIGDLVLPAIKIASPDAVNYPLLRAASALGLPLLISTGAASMQEILGTTEWLEDWDASYALLHCVSDYPAQSDDAHLAWIGQLAEAFDVPVGYSDHTADILSGGLAVAAGACIVERHLTYDNQADGPDHSASSDPEEFAQYVRMLRRAETLLGHGGKRVLACEEDVRRVSRQSLVAANDLRPGQVITEQDLKVQRPGTGIPAAEWPVIVGSRIACGVAAGTILTHQMIASARTEAA